MEKHGVVPDVIPVAPAKEAVIKYGNLDLTMGNELTPTQVKVLKIFNLSLFITGKAFSRLSLEI